MSKKRASASKDADAWANARAGSAPAVPAAEAPSRVSDPAGAIAFLTDQIDARASGFHTSVTWFRRRFYVASVAAVLLSSLITVIAGWHPDLIVGGITASNGILFLGSAVTVVSAWVALYSPKESWLVFARTHQRLRVLQDRILFLTHGADPRLQDSAFVDELFGAYQSILDAHNTAWAELRAGGRRGVDIDPVPRPGAVHPGGGV